MNRYLQYQAISNNKINELDQLVWRVGLDPYDGPDRKVSYWKQKTDSHTFYGRGPVDLSLDYDVKFYCERPQQEKAIKNMILFLIILDQH